MPRQGVLRFLGRGLQLDVDVPTPAGWRTPRFRHAVSGRKATDHNRGRGRSIIAFEFRGPVDIGEGHMPQATLVVARLPRCEQWGVHEGRPFDGFALRSGRPLSLCGVGGDSLCQQHQCGSCGRIVNRKESLQQIKAVACDRVRLKWHCVNRRRPSGRIRASGVSADRLQLNDITYIATLEGRLLLDLARRHHALPMSKNYRVQNRSIYTRASYVAVRVSSVVSGSAL
jgi:hypothetical protein